MASPSFVLSQAIYDEIIAHARAGKPREVCGILRGRGARAFEVVHARNVASEPVHDYEVDTQTLLRQLDFEAAGDEMVAIYHSHPATAAYPSASDAWRAYYPDCFYLICSLKDKEPVMRAFRLTEHDPCVDLDRLRAELEFDEARPGRFAYCQAARDPVPPALHAMAAQVPAPFYVIFQLSRDKGKDLSTRVVSVKREPLQIVPGD